MKKTMRVRLAVFLSIMMILPAIVAVLPMTAVDVSAASTEVYLSWGWNSTENKTIQVEQGQKFYIGDYASVSIYGKSPWYGKASLVKATYSSSKKSVATVNSKGYLTAKGTGTTTVTVKYKGKKITTGIEVVPAGTFETSDNITGLQKKADAIAKKIPSKITTKNGFELNKLVRDYATYVDGLDEISTSGFLKEKVIHTFNNTTYTTYKETAQLAVPQAGRYMVLSSLLSDYGWKNNPTGTTGAKILKIKSVSAKTSAITIKLKKKVDATQVLAARINGYSEENDKLSGNTKANINVYIYDTANQKSYLCKAVLKKGSNTLKLIPQTYSTKKGKWVTTKLTKGHTYRLESSYYWTKGKTVKVK